MKKAIIAAALLMAAPAQATQYDITGVGAASCAGFAQSMREDPYTTESVYLSWAQGYLSAMNMVRVYATGAPALPVFFAEQPHHIADDIWNHVRRYCDQHPLADFSDAVMAITE